jgi:hypothetical protein
MEDFKLLCGLPNVHDVMDGTHLLIYTKPSITYPKDYYYHKFGGYSMVAQIVVDFSKRFINTCIDLLGSMNNSWVLKRPGLCRQTQYHALFDPSKGCGDGTPPYLLGDKRYPLINWIMTLYKKGGRHIIFKLLYNNKNTRRAAWSSRMFLASSRKHSKSFFTNLNWVLYFYLMFLLVDVCHIIC